jgi:hypothetical protein
MRSTQSRVGPDLMRAVARIVDGYRSLLELPPPLDDPKAFTAHHAACRAALAHLEHVLRLIGMTEAEQTGRVRGAAALLAQARRANDLTEKEDDPDAP